MLKKLIEKSLAVVVAALAIFGFLCAWALWSLFHGGKAVDSKPAVDLEKPVPNTISVVPAVDASQAGEVCSCGSGVQCAGKRGGKFCVDENGNKRYK